MTRDELSGGAAGDRAYCAAILPRVSRTFTLSIAALPPELREAVRTAYLLCRVADSIEDDAALSPAERQRLFDAFDTVVADDSAPVTGLEDVIAELMPADHPDAQLCRAAGVVFRCFRALRTQQRAVIRPPLQCMSAGMRRFSQLAVQGQTSPIASLQDLEDYCYVVAGTVGEMLTGLFEDHCPLAAPAHNKAWDRTVPFGVGLQLVNIVKDVAEDAGRGVCYLPSRWLDEVGLSPETLFEPAHRTRGLGVLSRIIERARAHLAAAAEYTLLWPVDAGRAIRQFCAVPLLLARRTLAVVEESEDTLRRGRTPKMGRQAVMSAIASVNDALDNAGELELLLQPSPT
jgi:farnesyl-diphosphate farnesyltransferase